MGNFSFTPRSDSAVHTFQVDKDEGKSVKTNGVVLVVRSNWGSRDRTCLYRVRVHGE